LNIQNQETLTVIIIRLVRETKMAKELKEKYENTCQLCGCQLMGSDGNFISEAHHIKPYNRTHKGDDCYSNMIVLCPNHHAQFDQLFYAIEPKTHLVHCLSEYDKYHLKKVNLANGHTFDDKYLSYIWNLFLQKRIFSREGK
jgi:predicted restriction endonuclease